MVFLTSALDGDRWPTQPSNRIGTHCTGGQLGPRNSEEMYEKSRKQSMSRLKP